MSTQDLQPDEQSPTIDWVHKRREALAESADADRIPTLEQLPHGAMGLALSGGGERSATLSLGLIQAFSRNDRLFDFDYLSTVSGGGYFGCFLSSLFVPASRRGRLLPHEDDLSAEELADSQLSHADRRAFVEMILDADANEERVPDPSVDGCSYRRDDMRNPIWWLREHSRYLAPNGPTDYPYAIAAISRNWLAMIYTFSIFAFGFFLLLALAMYLPGQHDPDLIWLRNGTDAYALSPILILPAVLALGAAALGASFWLTASLDTRSRWTETWQVTPRLRFYLQAGVVLIGASAAFILANRYDRYPLRIVFWDSRGPEWQAIGLSLALIIAGAVVAVVIALTISRHFVDEGFTNELRRRITKCNASLLQLCAATLALGAIDTLVLLVLRLPSWDRQVSLATFAVAPPGLAWLFGKLPQWFGDGRLRKLLGEHLGTIALIAGGLAFGLLAFATDLAARWIGQCQDKRLIVDPLAALGAFVIIAGVLVVITGLSNGFTNLSSLNNFYAGRLTRAYLGAANFARLRQAVGKGRAKITDNHPADYIDILQYRVAESIAPIHLINATLNETRSASRSQLVDRDRKGIPVVFAPEGVLINAGRGGGDEVALSPDDLRKHGVDALSVGQLCAISGAAVSSAMGNRTSLGSALALTFANLRLGYWWTVNNVIVDKLRIPATGNLWARGPFATFYFLYKEMSARYSLSDRRVYLTDGGHFENSGAYELLRRKTKLIVVGDFGEDHLFHFEDLESLVRKARIDLGFAIRIASTATVEKIFGKRGSAIFLNRFGDSWRSKAADHDSGFALLLEVAENLAQGPNKNGPRKAQMIGRIIWLKPKLIPGLPEDIRGYAARHPGFPQQSTADQFFDEAQWECYRAIGYALGQELLTIPKSGNNGLRNAVPK
jgi:hypothetical protein